MAQEYAKRFFTKDGKTRITIWQQEYAENPRDKTDEPLHCEDWSREYSIMTKDERPNKSRNARALLEYFLAKYGDSKKMLAELKNNYKKDSPESYDNALAYDRREQEWRLYMWQPAYKDYYGHLIASEWEWLTGWGLRFEDLDMGEILEYLSDETIMDFAGRYLNDKIKMMSYGFGYNGDVSFYNDIQMAPDGIAWLEKDEFLKYSGLTEDKWNGKSLKEIEWLLNELEAWSEGEVYGYEVEHKKVVKVTEEHEDGTKKEYERIDWEEGALDSCWGFYGKWNKIEDWILSEAGFKKEDLEEEG